MATIGTDIQQAKHLLQNGELVAIPTETVYGLAADATNVKAVAKIFEVKDRPRFDPLIVHVASRDHLVKYVKSIPVKATLLAEKFWPGPLTLLLQKQPIIPDLVTSGLDTVGVRCPDHALTRRLLAELDFPLAAPSANPFGYVSPTTAAHVEDQLGEKIPYILDGGQSRVGIESTIVGFEDDRVIVHRLGGLSIDDIEAVVGSLTVQTQSTSNPTAPGQLSSHYAPRKKVVIGDIDKLLHANNGNRVGILSFEKDFGSAHQCILSPSGNVQEAAQNLFSALRMLDAMPIDVIITAFVPPEGLGLAINDRLKRAAH